MDNTLFTLEQEITLEQENPQPEKTNFQLEKTSSQPEKANWKQEKATPNQVKKEDTNALKKDYLNLLRSTKRQGIESVISWLEKTDFFTAPASTMFHGNYLGGLLEHSMNVAHIAVMIKEMLDNILSGRKYSDCDDYLAKQIINKRDRLSSISRESVLIVSLLHDICKANIYTKEKRNKKINGKWEEVDVYGVDYSQLPLGHGEKSVILLLRLGLELTDDELLAIRWHMSAWDLAFQSAEAKGNINAAKDKCLLLSVLQAADQLSTAVLEVKNLN